MADLILWKNQEMNRLRRDIDCLFDRFCTGFGVPLSKINIEDPFKMDISETEDSIVVTAEIPGMNREDIKVTATESALTVKGTTTHETVENGDEHHRIQRESHTFSRSIPLPRYVKLDHIEAAYKDDVLKIILPKRKPDEKQDRSIEIK